ncbi:helix-turn-helix domain-containing protein [Amphritea sp. 2_MG-2023]|uniref:helix-turn-helix domain-containing protein n=1 Tax=Amphritea TaxID=515417 RepID=UPI001C0768AC|nr:MULTISPECIES: helix-turn-helix domain-containing protein [Amphritea]MBU2965911.1 helix-turn-helix domain-containing protein [Amphritea atlantica]MDO6418002.1 helix-turn-helix domain-containing protein [Amphritea sp. 2_MG-2023]
MKSTEARKHQLELDIEAGLQVIEHALNTFRDGSCRELFPLSERVIEPTFSFISCIFDNVFDYAVKGYTSAADCISLDDLHDMNAFLHIASPAMEFYEGDRLTECEKVFSAMIARAKIDLANGGYNYAFTENENPFILGYKEDLLTLSEVALLANMNEKSVRNATHQTKDDRLETVKVGGRTYVTPEDGFRWLRKRRGFTPTVTLEEGASS